MENTERVYAEREELEPSIFSPLLPSKGIGGSNETHFMSICIVDDAGKIVREVKVASEPEALLAVLKNLAYHFKRIGLEAVPLADALALGRAGTR